MNAYPTPHIQATPKQFAETVLMPGDPLRSAFLANHFLDGAVLVNNVRGVQGYTGTYHGTRVSVMSSGMGMPSMGIYSHELFSVFGVERILRVGTAGGISEHVHVRELVLAMGCCTDSNFASQFGLPGTFAPIADFTLLKSCADTAKRLGMQNCHIGNVLTTDHFYNDEQALPPQLRSTALWSKMGVLAVEMETAALYMNAARFGKQALGLFTVSDHLQTGEALSAAERETGFTDMLRLALETVCS